MSRRITQDEALDHLDYDDVDPDVRALAHYQRVLRNARSRDPRDPDYEEQPPLHPRFSAPARRVVPAEPVDATTARFSRSLDERSPHTRSSTAVFVTADAPPMHHADRMVVRASALAGIALVVLLVFRP